MKSIKVVHYLWTKRTSRPARCPDQSVDRGPDLETGTCTAWPGFDRRLVGRRKMRWNPNWRWCWWGCVASRHGCSPGGLFGSRESSSSWQLSAYGGRSGSRTLKPPESLPSHTHSIGVQGVAIHGHDPPLLQCWAVVQSAESSLKSSAAAALVLASSEAPAAAGSCTLSLPCNLFDLDVGSGMMMMMGWNGACQT